MLLLFSLFLLKHTQAHHVLCSSESSLPVYLFEETFSPHPFHIRKWMLAWSRKLEVIKNRADILSPINLLVCSLSGPPTMGMSGPPSDSFLVSSEALTILPLLQHYNNFFFFSVAFTSFAIAPQSLSTVKIEFCRHRQLLINVFQLFPGTA